MYKIAATLFAGLTLASGQCNYGQWIFYPVAEGQCNTQVFGFFGYSSFMFVCDTSTSGTMYYYSDDDCSSGSLTNMSTPEYFDCSRDNCDEGITMSLDRYLGSTDCSSGYAYSGVLNLVDQAVCFNDTGSSFLTDVTSAGVFISLCDGDNCGGCAGVLNLTDTYCEESGSANSTGVTIGSWEDSGTTTEGPTTTPFPGTIGPYDCNMAVWEVFPLVNGECTWFEEFSDEESFMVDCASDGLSATISQYDNSDCSGNPVNVSNATYFYCGASGDDCIVVTMDGELHNLTNDCSGDVQETVQFNFAGIEACFFWQGFAYMGFDITDDEATVGIWADSDCEDTAFLSFTYSEGCSTNLSDSGSVDISFSSTTGTSGSGSGSGSESMETTGESGGSDSDEAPFTLNVVMVMVSVAFGLVATLVL